MYKLYTLRSRYAYVEVNGHHEYLPHGGAIYGVGGDTSKKFLWSNGSMYKLRGDNPLGGYNSSEEIIAAFESTKSEDVPKANSEEITIEPKIYVFPKLRTLDCPEYIEVNGVYNLLTHGGAVYGFEKDTSKEFLWSNGSMYKLRGDNPLGGYNSYEDLIDAFDSGR
jgi:hypothetical protein